MREPARYSMTIRLPGETVVTEHDSIAAVRARADWLGYVLGDPQPETPFYGVAHADGSDCTPEEMRALQPETSDELYAQKVASAVPPADAGPLWRAGAMDPNHGAATAAILRSGVLRRR